MIIDEHVEADASASDVVAAIAEFDILDGRLTISFDAWSPR